MKPETNIFGQKICSKKDCPAWFESDKHLEYGSFCEALMDFNGCIGMKDDGKKQFGVLCQLPIEFEIVRRKDEA